MNPHRSISRIAFLLTITFITVACAAPGSDPRSLMDTTGPIEATPAGSYPPPLFVTAPPPTSVQIALGKPVALGQPVFITVTLYAQANLKGVKVFYGSGVEDKQREVGDVAAGQTLEISDSFMFTREGTYRLVAAVVTSTGGAWYSWPVYVAITQDGYVLNPTPGPGAAAPAAVPGANEPGP